MLSILIADTKKEVTKDVSDTLSALKYDCKITTYSSGDDCMNIIRNGKDVDLVIVDISFADPPCFNLIRQIREDSEIPIVVLSYNKDINILVKALDAGANDYITRPFNKSIFTARLNAIVRRRQRAIEKTTKSNLNGGDAY